MNYDNNSKKFKDSDKAERNAHKAKETEKKNAHSKMQNFEKMIGIKGKGKSC
jgi:hypothetical protein